MGADWEACWRTLVKSVNISQTDNCPKEVHLETAFQERGNKTASLQNNQKLPR